MKPPAIFLLCLAAVICSGLLFLHAQDVAPLVPASGTTTVVSMAPPTSVRSSGPFNDSNPGIEGQFGMDQTDPNHVYIYHLNHWRYITTNTVVQP